MSDPLSSMIEALSLEVAAIRQGGGGLQVGLEGGSQVGQTREAWLYQFTVSQNLELRDETPVRLTAGANDVPGTLVTLSDGVLTVALEQDLGSTIDTARLVTNDSFLVERLKERLEDVRNGEVEFSRKSADRVIGAARVRAADAEPDRAVTADWTPNPDQLAAVRRSLGSDTTFVWGPPGTGKTTTLARIVEAHYRAGRSVLLVSNTNVAVDTALEKVAERLKGETDFYRGLVLRQGSIVKKELERRFGDQVSVEKVVETLGEALREEKTSIETEQKPLKDEARSLQEALQNREALALAERTLADRESERGRAAAIIAEREREAEQHRAGAVRLRRDLERVCAMGAVRRFFSRLRPEVLERSAWEAEQAAHAASLAAAALRADLPVHGAQIESLRSEIERLDARVRNAPPPDEAEARLDELHDRLVEIGMRLAKVTEALQELQQQVLDRCRVLATTVYRTYAGAAPLRRFDVVVIDEASMLVPPLVYYVAGLATRSVTVVGDFRQLPPIVISDEPLAAQWLRCDVFEKAGIPERVERHRPTPHLVALGTQYRMREPICELVNSLFYTSRPLATHPSANLGGEPFPFGSSPLLYVDTGPYHPWAALRVGSYSRYNLFHALLIHNLVLRLADTGFLPDGDEPNDAVGVVAPYAAQARLIQTLLDDRLGNRASGMSATVHRFQGNEKSAMVLDLTDSLGTRLGRFLKATAVDEVGARLLNVAASRARHHVVLVANLAYLRSKASPRSLVRRMADHFTEHGEPVDVTSLLPYGGAESVPVAGHLAGVTRVFTERSFYPAFEEDLAKAKESIVLVSPFATKRGTGRWVDTLGAKLAAGVKVRVLTRPPGEHGSMPADYTEEVIDELRDLGVGLDLRSQMHEKVAILDDEVLWHGSLNILSHRDTEESMLRFRSPAVCQELASYVFGKAKRRRRGRGAKKSVRPRQRPRAGSPCPEPDCDGQLTERNGQHGPFLGCSKYPSCTRTENFGGADA